MADSKSTFPIASSRLRGTSICVPADMGQSLDQGSGVSSGCRVTSSSWFAWDCPDFSMPWAIWDSWLPYTGTFPSRSLPSLEHCWGWGVERKGKRGEAGVLDHKGPPSPAGVTHTAATTYAGPSSKKDNK